MSHTRGPWRRGKCCASVVADFAAPGVPGSDATDYYGGHLIAESVSPSNLDVIAAAPEMYEALYRLVDTAIYATVHKLPLRANHPAVLHALAVLAKAAGQ